MSIFDGFQAGIFQGATLDGEFAARLEGTTRRHVNAIGRGAVDDGQTFVTFGVDSREGF
jgi:hypothetical protein